jgi:N-acetylglucosaminyl-diphospho-decaprenol L-rhamnosyltransferase
MAPIVSIIVVSYNTREMTLACLRSIFAETKDASFEIIVWDNASGDGSAKAIAAEFGGHLKLFASQENLGFAAANNLAARNASGQLLLLLNPDTIVLDQAIDRLIDFTRSEPVAQIWGGRTVFANGNLNPASCWTQQSLWSLLCQAVGLSSVFRRSSLFNPEGLGGWRRDGQRRVDIVSGCFLLIRRDLWNRLEGFRPEFFMYGEEADLCLRARRHGAQPIVTSAATVVHHGGASEKVRADKLVRLLKAKMLLIDFHFSAETRSLARGLLFLWPESRFLVHALLMLLGLRGSGEKAKVWKEVINRRAEWIPTQHARRR